MAEPVPCGRGKSLSGLTALSAEFTIGEGELMAMMSSGMRPDEYDDPYQELVRTFPSLREDPLLCWRIKRQQKLIEEIISAFVKNNGH